MARNSLPRTDADAQAIPAEFRDSASLREFRRRLVSWFRRHGRVLPWRETADPYRIWVSEIMLQQTTVKAVIPYYERFLSRFPDIRSLAAASEGEVLQYWEGLGYYSRGRNLRLAAIAVCERYAGRFPETVAELQILPGIGRYTAGAIRSFAFDLPAPIVEANTLRLYCRLLAYDGDPASSAGQAVLWSFAETLQPGKSAGRLNQALMELGATVCLPVNPMCETCPVRRYCRAFAEGRQPDIPRPKCRPEISEVVEATCAIRHNGGFLVRRRRTDERWAGLWDFPRFPVQSVTYPESLTSGRLGRVAAEATERIREITGLTIRESRLVDEMTHSVTRYRIRLLCLTAELMGNSRPTEQGTEYAWRSLEELAEIPMPVTGRKFASRLST